MPTQTMTRKELVEAVEAGIQAAGYGDCSLAADSLRTVAKEAHRINVGSFIRERCGCPLTQAGFWAEQVGFTPVAKSLGVEETSESFFVAFDLAIKGSGVFYVVDKAPEDFRTYLAISKVSLVPYVVTCDLTQKDSRGDVPAKLVTCITAGGNDHAHTVESNGNDRFYGVDDFMLTEIESVYGD